MSNSNFKDKSNQITRRKTVGQLTPWPGVGIPPGTKVVIETNDPVTNELKVYSTTVSVLLSGVVGAGFLYKFVDMHFPTYLTAGESFGFFSPLSDYTLIGFEISVIEASDGGDITFDLVTAGGTEQNINGGNLPALLEGETSVYFPLDEEHHVNMPAGSQWRLKIKSTGTNDPGAYLHVRMILLSTQ